MQYKFALLVIHHNIWIFYKNVKHTGILLPVKIGCGKMMLSDGILLTVATATVSTRSNEEESINGYILQTQKK